MMNFIRGLGDPTAESAARADQFSRLQSLYNTQVAAEEGRQNRIAAANVRQVYRDPMSEVGMPSPQTLPGLTPVPITAAPVVPAAPVAPAAPAAPAPAARRAAAPATAAQRTPVSQATENQSAAESRRLAGKPTPAEAGAQGERPGARTPALETAKRQAELRRFEELKRLAPPIATPNESAAETMRLNRAAAAAAPAQDASFEAFKNAIFGQESGNGAVDTTKPNYAGALGKGQILQSTFEGLKAQGKIPANYQWTNPQHNEEAAIVYMREAWQATGGNPELAAAYYYGGPKAVANGQVVPYRDLKNPNAPTTNQYAQQILQRMGQAATTVVPSAQAAQPAPAAAAPVATTPQMFEAQQFASFAPQVSEQVRMARMRLAQINRLMQVTRDVASLEKLNGEAFQQNAVIFEGQLYDAATRAQAGDENALSQLAQVVGIPFARTNQGFVTVAVDPNTGAGRATSQPMDQGTFARLLFQRASTVARQAEAAAATKRAEQQAQMQRELAVEQVKQQGQLYRELAVEDAKARSNMQKAMVESEGRIQEELLKNQLTSQNVANVQAFGLNQDQVLITRKDGRVFLMQPGTEVNGMRTAPQLVPVQ